MADITKCNGESCIKKDTCYRFIAETNPYRQSYFMASPIDIETNICSYYIDIKDKKW